MSADVAASPNGAGLAGDPSTRRAGLAAVMLATVFWSFGGVLGKATGAPGEVLSFWRMWAATLAMTVVVATMRRWPSWAEIRAAAPLGVLFGLNVCAFFITIEYLPIAVALIIGALTPVVALPIAVTAMGERLTAFKLVCALVAVGGVVVSVLAAPSSGGGESTVVGYVWAVVSLLIWVAYLLLSKRVRGRVETVRFMFVMSAVGALAVSVIVLVNGSDLGAIHGIGWLWVVLLALGPGLAGHGLLAWAHPRVDSSVSSVLIQAEPVGAAVAAWVFLGQAVTFWQAVAMGVVLVALASLAYREASEGEVELDEAVS